MRIKLLALAAVALSLFFAAEAASALEVERTVTSEGLVVLHVERDNLPVVVFTLLVDAGSSREPSELAGLASLTASLLDEGTARRTSMQISEEVSYIGARLGVSAGRDFSTLTLKVLRKDLEKGLDVYSDILLNPSFPPEEIARVKDLVKGSLREMEERPSFLARRAFMGKVFGDHPYGRIPKGTPETVDAIEREDIVRFHEKYYAPGNSILAVVGDISSEELQALLEKHLGAWTGREAPPLEAASPAEAGGEVVRIDRDLTQANILLGHLGVSRGDPDFYPLRVMNYILGGGGFSSRLMESIRQQMGLAYDVHSFFPAGRLAGTFRAVVQTKNSTANEAIGEIIRQMRLMRQEKVTPEELEGAKAFLVGSFPRKLETMDKIANFLVRVEYHGLGPNYMEEYPRLIESVTADDVLRAAREHLRPESLVIVVVADQEEAQVGDAHPAGPR
ncbi:MAG: pitrilysin family protein [Nitrospirota bacterium]|jgi:zinc protease